MPNGESHHHNAPPARDASPAPTISNEDQQNFSAPNPSRQTAQPHVPQQGGASSSSGNANPHGFPEPTHFAPGAAYPENFPHAGDPNMHSLPQTWLSSSNSHDYVTRLNSMDMDMWVNSRRYVQNSTLLVWGALFYIVQGLL